MTDTGGKTKSQQEFIRRIKAKKGVPVDELDDEKSDDTVLISEAEPFYAAFVTIMTQRGLGKGGRPLPLTVADIKAASDILSSDPHEKPAFLRFLVEMDRVYIEVRSEQITKQEKHAAGRNKGRK